MKHPLENPNSQIEIGFLTLSDALQEDALYSGARVAESALAGNMADAQAALNTIGRLKWIKDRADMLWEMFRIRQDTVLTAMPAFPMLDAPTKPAVSNRAAESLTAPNGYAPIAEPEPAEGNRAAHSLTAPEEVIPPPAPPAPLPDRVAPESKSGAHSLSAPPAPETERGPILGIVVVRNEPQPLRERVDARMGGVIAPRVDASPIEVIDRQTLAQELADAAEQDQEAFELDMTPGNRAQSFVRPILIELFRHGPMSPAAVGRALLRDFPDHGRAFTESAVVRSNVYTHLKRNSLINGGHGVWTLAGAAKKLLGYH